MDTNIISEIVNKLKDSIKEYKDIQFKFSTREELNGNGFKIEIIAADPGKIKEHQDRLDIVNERISKSYGFTQNIVGMEFNSSSTRGLAIHKISSFKPRNTKYPIITTEISSGKSYKFPIDTVKKKLGGDKLINRSANLEKLLNK